MIHARQAIWMLLLVPACFHPHYDHPACGPNGECPNGLICSAQQICEALGDAPDPDAAGSDSLQCPASYNVATLPGPSRYRLIIDGHRAWEQSDDCNDDLPGSTHLVVIESPQELTDVKKFIMNVGTSVAGAGIWIGAVQPITATSPDDGWLSFDGAPLINGWAGSEPNDGDNNEVNHQEQFVMMARGAPYFIDNAGNNVFGAICECDGKPIDPNVATVINNYRL